MGEERKLKRLNLRTPKSFAYNWSETENPRIRFFLVTEGPTEESYFDGIKNNKRELGIKNDIHIEIIPKEEGDENMSHPCQLVTAALECMGRIDENGNEYPPDKWQEHCKWDLDFENDRVCVIFDRDYRHLETKLDWIYEKCEKHNIFIGISNPNFELWLLMHFPDIDRYAPELLLGNPKNLRHKWFEDASEKKKYLEILVAKTSGGYTKGSKLRFERFISGIPLAIEQEKHFEEDVVLLREKLGSNVGVLIEKMKCE